MGKQIMQKDFLLIFYINKLNTGSPVLYDENISFNTNLKTG